MNLEKVKSKLHSQKLGSIPTMGEKKVKKITFVKSQHFQVCCFHSCLLCLASYKQVEMWFQDI